MLQSLIVVIGDELDYQSLGRNENPIFGQIPGLVDCSQQQNSGLEIPASGRGGQGEYPIQILNQTFFCCDVSTSGQFARAGAT